MKNNRMISLVLVLGVVMMVLASCAGTAPEPFSASRIGGNTDVFQAIIVENNARVDGTLTAAAISGPVTGNVTGDVTGNLTGNVTGDANIDDLVFVAGSPITVTNGAAFTVTAAYQPITASGTVTPTITVPSAGTRTCLVNTANQTINIADVTAQKLASAFAMGQYDTPCLLSDGAAWLELSRSNN